VREQLSVVSLIKHTYNQK